ncbi:hypothetical protein M434DRAFT_30317 [Hypoxylon sp. CO27-5]|nr:hypothetical protein M434DRAFT_30317 [Hypoxylon sp. CO27-5]
MDIIIVVVFLSFLALRPIVQAAEPDPISNFCRWGFNTKTYDWTQYDVSMDIPERPSSGASAEAPELGMAFYLNGMITNMSSTTHYYDNITSSSLEGMVVLDLQNHTAMNRSTDIITNNTPRTRGGMVYIASVGKMGILVSVGGAMGVEGNLQLVNMGQISVFDVESVYGPDSPNSNNGWYTQYIAGTVPSPRVDFCLIVVSAPDNTSSQIFMYGGWNPILPQYYDEVWVLSIPSFTWIKVNAGVSPRFGHTCHLVGNRQMLTSGGLGDNPPNGCDWKWRGVAILDLYEVIWGEHFTVDSPPYQVSPRIFQVIGGGPGGGAEKMLPDGGWSSTSIANLFTRTTDQNAPFSPLGFVDEKNSSGRSSNVSKGIIAGSVVGGLTFVSLVIIGFFLSRRGSKRKKRDTTKTRVESRAERDELDGIPRSELDIGVRQTHAEASGNPISELFGRQVPSELASRRDSSPSKY